MRLFYFVLTLFSLCSLLVIPLFLPLHLYFAKKAKLTSYQKVIFMYQRQTFHLYICISELSKFFFIEHISKHKSEKLHLCPKELTCLCNSVFDNLFSI